MSTMVSKFTETATGPTRFSKELRVSTEPVNIFFTSLYTLNGLKEEMSESVLGGDIFSLLSQSLQQILLQPEWSEQEKYHVRPPKAGNFPGLDRFDVKETSKFIQKSFLAEESKSNFSPALSPSESKKKPFPLNSSKSSSGKKEPFNEPGAPELSKFPSLLEILEHNANRPSFPAKDGSDEGVEQKKVRVDSIFVQKLREYWHLSWLAQTNEPEGSQLTEVKAKTGKSVHPLSPSLKGAFGERFTPEMTGGLVALKLGAFVSGDIDASKRVGQTGHPGASEKVGIQNTFHTEVKSESDRTTGLSERIADILCEQALQHGIDIT